MKKTKIVCTLGPASHDEAILKEMLLNGMNVARFNFSHGSHEEHRSRMDLFRKVRDELKVPAALLLDTKGPEIRLKEFKEGNVTLNVGDEFTLTTRDVLGDQSIVAMTYQTLPQEVYKGCIILIDDGKVGLEVISTDGKTDVLCKITNSGRISNKKGVNVPEIHLNLPVLSENDKKDLLFGITQNVDFVAASFVRNKEDVQEIRDFLKENKGEFIQIISKIESQEGVENFEEILEASDGIMIARGDMGVEIECERLPGIQKRFIERCCEVGKVVITATQMLDSMISNPTPTRAEITDVANAVYDGTTAIMLSGESANGKYPALAVKTMKKIACKAENEALEFGFYRDLKLTVCPLDKCCLAHSAKDLATNALLDAIVCLTDDGSFAKLISKFRPNALIFACTKSHKTYSQLVLSRGVYPVLVKEENEEEALKACKALGYLQAGQKIVYAASCCNLVKIIKL